MRSTLRLLLPIGLLALLAVGLAACGGGGDGDNGASSNDLPGNAVAQVGEVSVTKDDFTHWLNVAAVSSAQQTGAKGAAAQAPVPPDFTACVAGKKENAPKPAKGQPTTTDAQYKAQCKQEYESLRDQVMSFLISAQWIQQEAAKRNITITDAQLQKDFDKTKKQSFPKDADYQKFLKSSGMTEQDILFRVKLDSLSNKLREQVVKGKDNVTDAQIATYYNKNKQRFATPETRDVRIVLTKTEAQANAAKKALEGGESWSKVAKQYSIDEASKGQGGLLSGIAKGQQEKALDDALFGAKKSTIGGPVKTQFGWYVYEVEKITPANQQTQQQASATIKQLLQSQNQQKALDGFVKDFQNRFKGSTVCRTGYVTQDCSNAPKQKTNTTTTPAGGATTNPAPATTG
ncbi:peptidyl-prolyl cis-trans isomerase [Capillimicrobium parvum]|uniref:Foldase protein PrsA n=1 Tax=Capillimicrobium parvum TaxID=2884022 RepID=A0A9E7BZT2_9ACTN|nr:peptidyl-prolyl cis-trans isomerase [Capillimicrobium parvum]UGS34663.1 Foldase protein PrsA [Capillimicrobium parvum]